MKATPGNGKVSGFAWGGEPIVKYINSLPYTAQMLERRAARLAQMNEPVQIMHEFDKSYDVSEGSKNG